MRFDALQIDAETDMASETIKALMMISLFGILQIALHLPSLLNSPGWKRVRRAMVPHWPHWTAHAPIYATVPVRIRSRRR